MNKHDAFNLHTPRIFNDYWWSMRSRISLESKSNSLKCDWNTREFFVSMYLFCHQWNGHTNEIYTYTLAACDAKETTALTCFEAAIRINVSDERDRNFFAFSTHLKCWIASVLKQCFHVLNLVWAFRMEFQL